MEIGVITELQKEKSSFEHVKQFGLNVCQLVNWDESLWCEAMVEKTIKDIEESKIKISAVWAGVPGPADWDFVKGPVGLGLVPKKYRKIRLKALRKGADFAKKIGVKAIITHFGFLPENITDKNYKDVLNVLKDIGGYCADIGIEFWFETGQETPVVLLRFIEESKLSNLGINLDPANLIMYGKGNPIDALDVFGKYVTNVHAKDGCPPTNGKILGEEVPIGQGSVRFPEFIKKLKRIGYAGELILEREISGEEQDRDIRKAVADLKQWVQG